LPYDITSFVGDPATTALVINEVQPGTMRTFGDCLANIIRLADAARDAGIQVMHCVKVVRNDALARNKNIPLYRRSDAPRGPDWTPDATPSDGSWPAPELGPDPRDIVMTRIHGMGSATDSGVVPVLLNLGIRNVVLVGVSVNVGILSVTMDLMNYAFEVVIPRDAISGTPPEYVDMVVKYTLKNLATITTTDDVLDVWSGLQSANAG
jgi:nicotinamidase-related amidase